MKPDIAHCAPLDATLTNPLGEALLAQWPGFSQSIVQLIQRLGLDTLNLECDHVALRVNSNQAADVACQYFAQLGRIISNNQINGRAILIIELAAPLMLANMAISCVELPYPSNKSYPTEGWEHIELVLPCDAISCESLIEALEARVPTLARLLQSALHAQEAPPEFSDIAIKLSSPKGDKERLANPTIAFKADGVCVKIHPHGIKAVIASERS